MIKNAQIGGNFTFFEILKWIPIGAARESNFDDWMDCSRAHSDSYSLDIYWPTLETAATQCTTMPLAVTAMCALSECLKLGVQSIFWKDSPSHRKKEETRPSAYH
jgi:hypothetical protein